MELDCLTVFMIADALWQRQTEILREAAEPLYRLAFTLSATDVWRSDCRRLYDALAAFPPAMSACFKALLQLFLQIRQADLSWIRRRGVRRRRQTTLERMLSP